ncbi:SPOR domain-containing protein [Paracoccus salsus]|uniref:SPOR domain-containing protein n=1 Tax=Paracoccus salsus TaxID=2911061 RepID=UPI001F2F79E7|nr:SPOR domain-containing protein [Paracoccus salsus]MCF3972062.1 SPOR domain-containing protein [Paracoccus salsus]
MRVLLGVVFWLGGLAMGQAAPVPLPPADFGGSQYVDGSGCVYQRDGAGWTARRDKAGARICGFPPTLSSRRLDPDLDRLLAPEDKEAPRSPEDLLAEQLASGLRQGEFVADPRPAEIRTDPLLPQQPSPIVTELSQFAAHEAALRGALTGAGRSGSALCTLLGYEPDPNPVLLLGGDVTQGLCPGMRAPVPEQRFSDIAPGQAPELRPSGASPAAQAKPRSAQSPAIAAAGSSALTADRRAGSSPAPAAPAPKPPVPGRAEARPTEPPQPAAPDVEMIPPTARYVQVGAYADDENADSVIRRLSSLGYRVAQKRMRKDYQTQRLILAGPFSDRAALVAALNRLRAEGYPGAVAR